MPPSSIRRRRVLIVLAAAFGAAAVASAAVIGWGVQRLDRSLPSLEGTAVLPGLSRPVTVERDRLGVPRLDATTPDDGFRALGFLHAQERFFQMDLLRRQAAGELSALVGAAALPADREARLHRMRARARRAAEGLSGERRRRFEAYRDGVNAGLGALGAAPFEYLLLGSDPARWRVEDSFLAVVAMYFVLNDATGAREVETAALEETLPPDLAGFLMPLGTEEDAPIVGEPIPTPEIPPPESFAAALLPAPPAASAPSPQLGSNSFAVAPGRAAGGLPLLASDMHLPLGVPNIWYRAEMRFDGVRLVGLTLPGVPTLVAGSNGRVAWAFTNTGGDWLDLVELETDPDDPLRYRAPGGWRRMEIHAETIEVAGGGEEVLEVRETVWGPVTTRWGRPQAVRWIAHDPEGLRPGYLDVPEAASLDDAFAAGRSAGMPPQNLLVADREGAIGWTVAGPIPRRRGLLGEVPASWADGDRGWDGYLPPDEIPEVRQPDAGLLWTANQRMLDGDGLDRIGRGGRYAHGERALLIRDRLRAAESTDEAALLDIQLEDRAPGLDRWRRLFLGALEGVTEPRLREAAHVLETGWTGGARLDSSAYPLARDAVAALRQAVYGELTSAAARRLPGFSYDVATQWRGPLERLATERPLGYVPGGAADWEEALAAAVRSAASRVEGPLADRVWADESVVHLRHPLSPALPRWLAWFLAPRLDAAPRPLPGDSDLPRAQRGATGASNRFVVAPGREETAILHMPGGQAGHPRSPYYLGGHLDWEEGRPAPFLAGPAVWRLVLEPGDDQVR